MKDGSGKEGLHVLFAASQTTKPSSFVYDYPISWAHPLLNILLPNVVGTNSYTALQGLSINAMTAELPTVVSDVLLHRLHFMHHHIHFFHITHEHVLSLSNCPLLDSLTDVLYIEPQ